MNENTILAIDVFDPEETLITLLKNEGVEFKPRAKHPAVKIAKDETVDIIGNSHDASQISVLAAIFVEWLVANDGRKMQAQMKDCSIIYLEGYAVEDVIKILTHTIKVIAFDPEYNHSIFRHQEN